MWFVRLNAAPLAQLCLWCLSTFLVACSGSSDKNPGTSSSQFSSLPGSSSSSSMSVDSSSSSLSTGSSSESSSSSVSSTESSSSATFPQVTISGRVTYDYVPFRADFVGLDYSAVEAHPVRAVMVELLGADGGVIDQTMSDENGRYSLSSPLDTLVRVQVSARLKRSQEPTWDISVTDNTRENSLYVLAGSLTNSGETHSQRNLHAPSGWGSSSYTGVRAAAPFAILDTVYVGLQRLLAAGNTKNLPPLEFRWSENNITAAHPDGDYATGEIGTSFFDGRAIYVLGEQDSDTDEYDSHVILHEWTHYLEDVLARSDSLGGAHGYNDRLDLRVAHSEGLANALAAMLLDDGEYRDSGGVEQGGGFAYNVAEKNHHHRGWFSEASVESVLYNYYLSDAEKTPRDLSYVLAAFRANDYRQADSFVSIHLFIEQLQNLYPTHQLLLDELLAEQLIFGRGAYAEAETNDGGYAQVLPVYKPLVINASAINVCSTPDFGKYNKLGVAQFLRLTIEQTGTYQMTMTKNGGDAVVTDPDFVIYQRGKSISRKESNTPNIESGAVSLQAGEYLVEVYDWKNRDQGNIDQHETCFDFDITQ